MLCWVVPPEGKRERDQSLTAGCPPVGIVCHLLGKAGQNHLAKGSSAQSGQLETISNQQALHLGPDEPAQ